jgi:Domain of unknown function (DUF5615)
LSVRFLADADLNFDVVKAVRRREPGLDFASAADAGIEGTGDPEILERAASQNRVLVSHDRRTMLHHFRNRLAAGKFSPGLLVVSQNAQIRPVVEAILVLWSVSDPAELRDQVYHLPSLFRHVFPR